MKLGTFVGQKFLQITDEEKQYILDAIKNTLCKRFNVKAVKFEPSDICPSFRIEMFDGKTNYRLSNGNLVNPQYIRVKFTSEQGYDEAEYGPFYTWAEDFKPEYKYHSYSLGIDVFGHERAYRCRTTSHNVGIRQTDYKYGSELNDLEIESGLNKLCGFIDTMMKHQEKAKII